MSILVYLWLVSHPTVFVTQSWTMEHMYVCVYVRMNVWMYVCSNISSNSSSNNHFWDYTHIITTTTAVTVTTTAITTIISTTLGGAGSNVVACSNNSTNEFNWSQSFLNSQYSPHYSYRTQVLRNPQVSYHRNQPHVQRIYL